MLHIRLLRIASIIRLHGKSIGKKCSYSGPSSVLMVLPFDICVKSNESSMRSIDLSNARATGKMPLKKVTIFAMQQGIWGRVRYSAKSTFYSHHKADNLLQNYVFFMSAINNSSPPDCSST